MQLSKAKPRLSVPRLSRVKVGAAVDIDEGGIFLAFAHVGWSDEAVVEVGDAVGGLDGAEFDVGHGVFGEGVGDVAEGGEDLTLGVAEEGAGGSGEVAVAVDEGGAGVVDLDGVGARFGGEELHVAGLDIDFIAVASGGVLLVGVDEEVFALGVEGDDAEDVEIALGELADQFAGGAVEVEMLVAVAFAEPEEEFGVARDEEEALLGVDVAGVGLFEEHFVEVAGFDVVAFEPEMVLLAADFGDIEVFFVGAPGEVGEVVFAFVEGVVLTRAEVGDFFGGGVVDADGDLVALHARHGVFERFGRSDARGGVDERIVGDHGFVHAVEGEVAALGGPEGALFDAEFVAVDRLTEDDARVGVLDGDDLAVAVDIEVVVDGVGLLEGVGFDVEIFALGDVVELGEGAFFEVVEVAVLADGESELLVAESLEAIKITERLFAGGLERLVDVGEGEDILGGAGVAEEDGVVLGIGHLAGIGDELEANDFAAGIELIVHGLLDGQTLVLSEGGVGEEEAAERYKHEAKRGTGHGYNKNDYK